MNVFVLKIGIIRFKKVKKYTQIISVVFTGIGAFADFQRSEIFTAESWQNL